MNALELHKYLLSLSPYLPTDTVDRIVAGDPEQPVRGVAVCWMAYNDTLRQAAAAGVNVIVTHEPTFYNHFDRACTNPEEPNFAQNPEFLAKHKLIEDLGLTVMRCHDGWDCYPVEGIQQAWADFLGVSECLREEHYHRTYRVPTQRAGNLARGILSKVKTLGQDCIGFYGDPERVVDVLGIGTGCGSNPVQFQAMGAQMAIAVDDIMTAWIRGEWCQDCGFPTVILCHGTAEEPGISRLAEHLRKKFPGLPVQHIPQGASYSFLH